MLVFLKEVLPYMMLVGFYLPVRFFGGAAYIRGKHKNTRVGKCLPVWFMGCVCWVLQSCFEQLFGEFVDIILDLFAALGARVL